jgi:8-oxo-dGTP diphosphatase
MYTYEYQHPAVTVDIIVFAEKRDETKVLLIERKNKPYKGCWAFPGGFVNIDETAEDAARRELKEETNLEIENVWQVGAFSKVDRDPRERVITIAFYAIVYGERSVSGSDDASRARWFSLNKLPELAFDHADILNEAMIKARVIR